MGSCVSLACPRSAGGWGAVEIAYINEWVDHQKNKFFINNTIETLIRFNEGHQSLLKLYVPLGWGGSSVWEEMGQSPKEETFYELEK